MIQLHNDTSKKILVCGILFVNNRKNFEMIFSKLFDHVSLILYLLQLLDKLSCLKNNQSHDLQLCHIAAFKK